MQYLDLNTAMTCNTVRSLSQVIGNEDEENTFPNHLVEQCLVQDDIFKTLNGLKKIDEGNNYKIYNKKRREESVWEYIS